MALLWNSSSDVLSVRFNGVDHPVHPGLNDDVPFAVVEAAHAQYPELVARKAPAEVVATKTAVASAPESVAVPPVPHVTPKHKRVK